MLARLLADGCLAGASRRGFGVWTIWDGMGWDGGWVRCVEEEVGGGDGEYKGLPGVP